MLRKRAFTQFFRQSRQFFSESNNTPKEKNPPAPVYNPVEFEPFKFKYERENLIYGYTLQELYGKRFGLKHSPAVRKEIAKDDAMIVIAIVGSLALCIWSREQWNRETEAWENYIYHDMNYYRNKDTGEKAESE
jgi:hypothetical protein